MEFKQHPGQNYGFDEYVPKIPQFYVNYGHGKVNNENYHVAWKSAESFGPTDLVKLEITATVPDSIKSRLSIETETGQPLNFVQNPNDKSWELSITGLVHESINRLTAWYKQDDGSRVAVGYLDLANYQRQQLKVNIVPVNMAKQGSEQQIKDYLNKVYSQAITSWDVAILDPLEVEFEANGTEGLDTELPGIAAYTKEMRTINDAMKARSDYDPDAYYLFLIPKSEKGDKNGIMPFARHFGYIFMDATKDAEKQHHTMAHELGHGAFCLKHPWQEKGTTEGQTYSIMDYRTQKPNTLLYKYQWDEVHNPKISLFGGDEEEVSSVVEGMDLEGYYLSPNGKPIYLPSTVTKICFVPDNIGCPSGALQAFVDKGNLYQISISDPLVQGVLADFNGYISNKGKYIDSKEESYKYEPDKFIRVRSGIQSTSPDKGCRYLIQEKNLEIQSTYKQEALSKEKLKQILKDFAGAKEYDIRCLDCFGSQKNLASNIYVPTDEDMTNLTNHIRDLAKKIGCSIKMSIPTNLDSPVKLDFDYPTLFPNFTINVGCVDELIAAAIDELHKSDKYKKAKNYDKRALEIGVIIRKFFWVWMQCSLGEEACVNDGPVTQFIAGAAFEMVNTFNIEEAVDGILAALKEGSILVGESYIDHFKKMRDVYLDARKGNYQDLTPEKVQDLVEVLIPPNLKITGEIIGKSYTLSKALGDYYFDFSSQTIYWRYGQLTVMVVPIIITGGEWAVTKIKKFTALNKSKNIDDVVSLVKEAKESGKNVISRESKLVIESEDEITTISRDNDVDRIETLVKGVDELLSRLKQKAPLKGNPDLIQKFEADFGNDLEKLSIFDKEAGLVESWKILRESHPNSFIKTDVLRLEVFNKLNIDNQKLISQFTDADASSTLAKFLDDCDDDFLKFVNDPENALEVKGFLAHKEGMLTAEENLRLSEMLEQADEIPNQKVRDWLEYGDNMAVFKANREAGNKFGSLMKTQLGDVSSEAYKKLKTHLEGLNLNIDDYSIYSQVQLCLKGDCINKGNYWIPDFMLVAERTGPSGKYLETIIVDAKLSGSTGWTKNQGIANDMNIWSVKTTISADKLIKGAPVDGFYKNASVNKNGKFIKLFSENGSITTK